MKWWAWTCTGSLSSVARSAIGLLYGRTDSNEWFLIQTLLAAFLFNAFALMFHHVLIYSILLLTACMSLIYSLLCICSQLKDISLNTIMRCDGETAHFPWGIFSLQVSRFQWFVFFILTGISSSALWTPACFAGFTSCNDNWKNGREISSATWIERQQS